MSTAVVCPVCINKFSTYSGLRCHVKTFHPDKLREISFSNPHLMKSRRVQCPLCIFYDFKPAMMNHFRSVHDIDVKTEHIDFSTMEQLKSWKNQIEANNNVSFIHHHGTSVCTDYSRTVFICSRSGKFKSKGLGLRRLKKQGSKKLNGFCPAAINIIYKNGIYSVEYTSAHVGHNN